MPSMKTLALAVAFLLVGCATSGSHTTVTNARSIKPPNKGEQISEREQQCVRQAVNRTNDQIAQIEATLNALTASRTRQAKDDRDREVSKCIANADREMALLSARERAEYESEAQQEHDHAVLMMILTTSRPH
jgi:Spy/CpxP family protein refolding chaperone